MNRPSPLIPFLCLALGAAHPAQESPAVLPPPVHELLAGKDFQRRVFDRAAAAMLRQAGTLEPLARELRRRGDRFSRRLLVEVLRAQGRPAPAWEIARALVTEAPRDPELLELAAHLADALDRKEEAVSLNRRLLATKPRIWIEWTGRLRQALLLFAAGRKEEGKEQLQVLARKENSYIAASAARLAGLLGERDFAGEYAGPVDSPKRRTRFLSLMQAASMQERAGRFDRAAASLAEARELARARRERYYVAWAEARLHRRRGTLESLVEAWLGRERIGAERLYQLVLCLEELGRVDEALALLERPEAREESAREWTDLVLGIALERGRREEAEAILRGRLEQEPRSLDARAHLSRVLLDGGRAEAARRLWNEAFGDPQTAGGRRILALCDRVRRAGFPDLARERLRRAYREGKEELALWCGLELADLLARAGRPGASTTLLRELAEKAGDRPRVLRAVGEMFEYAGFPRQAVACYEGVLARRSGHDLELRLAWLQAGIGRGLEAVSRLRRVWAATESASRRRQVEERLLETAAKEGVLGELAEDLEERLERGTIREREVSLLVDLYTKVGDAVSAADVLDTYGALRGDRVAALRRLARVYMDTGEMRRYEETVRRLLEVDPGNAREWWMQLAMSALERGRPQDASEALRRLAGLGGTDHGFKAGVYAFARMHAEAAREYRLALAEDPDQVELWLLLCRELDAAGEKGRALALCQYLVDRPGVGDIFVIGVDGLLNLSAPAPVLEWALRRVRRKLALYPTKIYLYRLMSDILDGLGRKQESTVALEELVPVAAEQRGVILRRLLDEAAAASRREEVVTWGRQLMALGEVFPPQVHLTVGRALLEEDRLAEAARVFARASGAGRFVELQRQVASIYREKGRFARALAILRRLRAHAPEDPGLLAEIARAEESAGEAGAAASWRRAFAMVLERTPRSREAALEEKGRQRNLAGLDQVREMVVTGLCGRAARGGGGDLLAELAERTKGEIRAVGGGADPDTHPRLALLLDTLFRVSQAEGDPVAVKGVTGLLAAAEGKGGRAWIRARLPGLLCRGWVGTARILAESAGTELTPAQKWTMAWLAAGRPPAGRPPNLAAGLEGVRWHLVFRGRQAAREYLDRMVELFPPAERRGRFQDLAPLLLACGDRQGFADLFVQVLAEPGASGRRVSSYRLRICLAFALRFLQGEERERVVAAAVAAGRREGADSSWRTLALDLHLAQPGLEREALAGFLEPVLRGAAGSRHGGALYLTLAAPARRLELVETALAGKQGIQRARFLAAVPFILGPRPAEPLWRRLRRAFREEGELERLIGEFCGDAWRSYWSLQPALELELVDILLKRKPGNPALLCRRISLLLELGREEPALAVLEGVLRGKDGGGYLAARAAAAAAARVGAEKVIALCREGARAGSAAAAQVCASLLAGRGRLREALELLAAGGGEQVAFFQRRRSLLADLGRHRRAVRLTEEFLAAHPSAQVHHHHHLARMLVEQGRFREAVKAGRPAGGSRGTLDYQARQRLEFYARLPRSPRRDERLAADLVRFLRPPTPQGRRALAYQFNDILPANLRFLHWQGSGVERPAPYLEAARIPRALAELERTFALLRTEKGAVEVLRLACAVAEGLDRRELAARVGRRLTLEAWDEGALVLAAAAAGRGKLAQEGELVARAYGFILATRELSGRGGRHWVSRRRAFWADRLAACGRVEAAARLAGFALWDELVNASYWSSRQDETFQYAVQLFQAAERDPGELWRALAARAPLVPPEVLGQVNFLHRREIPLRLLEAGKGDLLLAECPRLVAEIASRRRPGLATYHLLLAGAMGQAGRDGEARRLLFLGLAGSRRRPAWVPPRVIGWALPAGREELLRVLAEAGRRAAELGRAGELRLLPPLALALEAAGAAAGAEQAWRRLLQVCGEEDGSERERIGLLALEGKSPVRARRVLRPLALQGRLSPGEAARILTFLYEKDGGGPELDAALLDHLQAFPRRDLALLAATRLRGEEARKAVALALVERPGDEELEEAVKKMGVQR